MSAALAERIEALEKRVAAAEASAKRLEGWFVFSRPVKWELPDPRIDRAIELVVEGMQVTREEILGRNRTEYVALARHVAMWLARTVFQLPFKYIGKRFFRDHGSVISAVKHVDDAAAVGLVWKATLVRMATVLRAEFGGGAANEFNKNNGGGDAAKKGNQEHEG